MSNLRKNARLEELDQRVARQDLMLQTLVRLLLEKNVIARDEFAQWLRYVDALDGREDGKLGADAAFKTCPKCKRTSPAKVFKCQYCGAGFPDSIMLTNDG